MGNSKMNARERIDYLFDDHSFVEVGGYVSARNTDYNLGAKKVKVMVLSLDTELLMTAWFMFTVRMLPHLEVP